MPCKEDVRTAILNTAIGEVTDGRNTFTRISEDSIRINAPTDNSKTKATSREQARAIAKSLIKRVETSFNGHVKGFMTDEQNQPVKVKFMASDAYIQHELNRFTEFEKTDETEDRERDNVNGNMGPISGKQLMLFDPASGAGQFERYVQFKKSQITTLRQQINKIEALEKNKDTSVNELTRLKNLKRETKLLVEGNRDLGIEGLVDQIEQLKKVSSFEALAPYVQKDVVRVSRLSESNNPEDLKEARRIGSFYQQVSTFSTREENPFFTQAEIFLPDQNGKLSSEFMLPQETMDRCQEWYRQMVPYLNAVDLKEQQVSVDQVNSDFGVLKTYGGKQFTFDDITYANAGLRDADWISMWTMDITKGIFSTNGILPQVAFSYLTNKFERKLGWSRDMWEKVDAINPQVQKELIKLGHTLNGAGIVGLEGASYSLFKETTKEGNDTGGLIRRYVKEFFDGESNAQAKFRDEFSIAKNTNDDVDSYAKSKAFNKAFEKLKKWRRENTIIMDISQIPEIAGDAEFAHFNLTVPQVSAFADHLKSVLGEKGYKEEVEKQKGLLRKYLSEKQSLLETALIQKGKGSYDELDDKTKHDMAYWEQTHSPLRGVEDYHNVTGIYFDNNKVNSFMNYNSFIPRKTQVSVASNLATDKYEFTETGKSTGYYSKNFETIENNKTLSDFYDIVKEAMDTIRETMPIDLQDSMSPNTIPAMMKTSAEIIADNSNGRLASLFEAFRHMWERLRVGFGVRKQSDMSYATVDPATGKTNYKVNDSFFRDNAKAVNDLMFIEKVKFLQAYNASINKVESRLQAITRFTTISLSKMTPSNIQLLGGYLHIENPTIDKIRAITGENVQIGKYIRDFSIHSVVQSQSFDLGKIVKYFSNMAMMYSARQEALPVLEILKKHYEGIQKPETNNLDNQLFNVPKGKLMTKGVREGAVRQFDDWFSRVALDDYGLKHKGAFSIGKEDGLIGKTIYTKEEREKLDEVNKLLEKEIDLKAIARLNAVKNSLGKTRTTTALIDNLYSWIRTMRLGYNLSSATTNFCEGVMSNMMLAESGEHFDPKEIYYGYSIVKHSFLKNLTFGKAETGLAKKLRSLMDKFDVIMDSKNELQKSSHKTTASKASWLNPHELNQRVEYINQSPVMVAMLRTLKIKGIDGSESKVWDAMDANGKLLPNFATDENKENWEHLKGQQYLDFKQKLHNTIVLGHGNYDELRGMMAKSTTGGKAALMFKTWIPMQLYWRFATQQDDIQAGTKGYKGRYYSYTPATGALHGAAVGAVVLGPVGAGIGAIAGGAFGAMLGKKGSDVNMLQETVEATKLLFRKSLGMPVNLLSTFVTGNRVIDTGDEGFNKFIGKGGYSEQDARNMRTNMADICMQLAFLAMVLMVKGMFWDDDDKPDDPERIAHNILVNKLMQLSSQAASYVNPPDTYKSLVGSNAVMQYLTDLGTFLAKVDNKFQGKDIIQSGRNAGESALYNQTMKTFVPGLFKNEFGFKSQADRVFNESWYHHIFKSEASVDKEENKRDRAERRKELLEDYKDQIPDEKEREKEVEKMVNIELPTPTKLKKLGVTREEYKQQKQ